MPYSDQHMDLCGLHYTRTLQGDSGETNLVSPSGNLRDKSGFGGYQENGTCLTAFCQVRSLGGGGDYSMELCFFRSWACSLSTSEIMLKHIKTCWTISSSQIC